MTDFEDPIDKIIREARERGEFKDLPGKGQPIRWEDESMVPEDQRMANRLLKNNDFTLDWIAIGQELDVEFEKARQGLEQARAERAAGRLDIAGWRAARQRYNDKVRELNRRIIGYNVRVPHDSLQRRPYRVEPDEDPPGA